MKKQVLLVRPRPHDETIGLQHVMVVEPLELEYAVSNLSQELEDAYALHIIDMILDRRSFATILETHRPALVAFTGYNTHVNVIKNLARAVKTFDATIVTAVGGVHAEVVPEDFRDDALDLCFWKNGVEALNLALAGLLQGRALSEVQEEIDGWERRRTFPYRPPAREAVQRYRKDYYYMFHAPCALLKTSFGCPYTCSFCFCRVITEGHYFTRPLSSVMEELRSLPEEEIYIVDDDFLLSPERVSAFMDLLEAEDIRKRYLVYGRADFIAANEPLLRRFRDLGLQAVIVGLESAREADLKVYDKRTSLASNERAIKILHRLGIEVYGTLILPLDFTRKDFKVLKQWLHRMDLTFVNLQPLTPLKGTALYAEYGEDFIEDPMRHERWDMAHVVLKPRHMSRRRFYYEIVKLYHQVVLRPKHVLRLLRKHGLQQNLKMLRGSGKVTWQYLGKMMRG